MTTATSEESEMPNLISSLLPEIKKTAKEGTAFTSR